MKISARFHSAISTARPRGVRILESYSPKLGRRLQCFGEDAFRQWIRLEADPTIETFCERPTYLNSGDDQRLVDFWTCQQDRETLLVLDGEIQATPITIDETELAVRTILPVDLAADRVWIGNWERMLPALISCRLQIVPSLQKSILKFITEPMPLARIEQEFVTGDPTLVRASILAICAQPPKM